MLLRIILIQCLGDIKGVMDPNLDSKAFDNSNYSKAVEKLDDMKIGDGASGIFGEKLIKKLSESEILTGMNHNNSYR
jgi:hypothetical protein